MYLYHLNILCFSKMTGIFKAVTSVFTCFELAIITTYHCHPCTPYRGWWTVYELCWALWKLCVHRIPLVMFEVVAWDVYIKNVYTYYLYTYYWFSCQLLTKMSWCINWPSYVRQAISEFFVSIKSYKVFLSEFVSHYIPPHVAQHVARVSSCILWRVMTCTTNVLLWKQFPQAPSFTLSTKFVALKKGTLR